VAGAALSVRSAGACSQTNTRNRLLAALRPEDFALLRPHLEPALLEHRQVLADYDTPIAHAYFPESGIVSMAIASPDGHMVETMMVGCEGLVGLPVVLGVDQASAKLFVQMPGHGWRIDADRLRELCVRSPPLHQVMLGYAHAAFMQVAYTALSNAAHSVEQRLARWLLMAHDRTNGDEVTLTHDFLALMLNIRRPSVTNTLHILEGMRLLRAARGRITIRDREGLEALASAAYGVPEAEYRRLMHRTSEEDRTPQTAAR